MFGFYYHPENRGMPIMRGEREVELGDDEGEKNLELNHGKVLAQADASTKPEWHVGLVVSASFGNSITEPLWSELVSVCSPYIRITVKSWNQSPYAHSFWHYNVADSSIGQRLS